MLYRLLIDVTREDGRDFPSVKHAITTGDKIPRELARGSCPACSRTPASSTSTAARRRTTASIHEFEGLADGDVPTNVPVGPAAARRRAR